ncbi:MAG: glycosyltransferase family 39 protein [Chloroflexi bacterium]|nr:glycosyltransferase family 39 protein [Chloroflexota bacterium]
MELPPAWYAISRTIGPRRGPLGSTRLPLYLTDTSRRSARKHDWASRPTGLLVTFTVLCFLFALMPRALVAPRMVTADEDTWIGMAANLAQALQRGRPGETYELGHPGITSLWLDIAGLGIDRAARLAGLVAHGEDGDPTRRAIATTPDFLGALAAARFSHALANAALVAILAAVAWRLLGPLAGACAGALLALDPFLVAHGQIARMDSLQALLVGIALLCAAVRAFGNGRWGWVAAGGVAFGLALLSKTSTLVDAPFIAAVSLAGLASRRGTTGLTVLTAIRQLVADGLVWSAVATAVFVALWPAMWVEPLETVRRTVEFTARNSGTPPLAGNYFMGAVVDDPGPLFYPVAMAFRLTPLACLGLALAVAGALRWRRQRKPLPREALVAILLAGCALAFVVALSAAPKKFDRYALPAIPPLLVVAGYTIARAFSWVGKRRAALGLAVLAGALHQVVNLPPVASYPLAYFTPLVGGPAVARQAMLVGWGEGMEQVASVLAQQPGAGEMAASAFHEETFGATFPGASLPLTRFAEAEYLVLPIDAEQRRLTPSAAQEYVERATPDVRVVIAGLDYVRAYRLPRPVFGNAVRIDRSVLEGTSIPLGDRLRIDLGWHLVAPAPRGVQPVLQLIDEQNEPASPPAEAGSGATSLATGQEQRGIVRLLSPRKRGRYRLTIKVVTADGSALPATETPPWVTVSGDTAIVEPIVIRYR